MHNTEKSASREDTATTAHMRALHRMERIDMVVAAMLLLLLIFGWVIRLAPPQQWPRGDFLIAGNSRHV